MSQSMSNLDKQATEIAGASAQGKRRTERSKIPVMATGYKRTVVSSEQGLGDSSGELSLGESRWWQVAG